MVTCLSQTRPLERHSIKLNQELFLNFSNLVQENGEIGVYNDMWAFLQPHYIRLQLIVALSDGILAK